MRPKTAEAVAVADRRARFKAPERQPKTPELQPTTPKLELKTPELSPRPLS